jgi:hypothetical protein
MTTFRDSWSVPSSRIKHSKKKNPLKMGSIGCPETSAKKSQLIIRNIPVELFQAPAAV